MKVILASPDFHQQRGNTVTVQRIADGLETHGVDTEIVSVTGDPGYTSLPEADLIHGFHAYKFFSFKQRLKENQAPFVITMTGTDLNHDLFDESRRAMVLECLKEASAITVFDETAKETLMKEMNGIHSKIHVIHQGTSNLQATQRKFSKQNGTFLFVLPAGIRKVKNIPFAIHALKKLHNRHPKIRLLLVGPIIEHDEGRLVENLTEENSDWISYIGQLPHKEMGAAYEHADVVLNTSHSEGQPAAILEAMEHGLPVIASSNTGNRNIVTHGKTGFVYTNESEFLDYAETLLNNNQMRKIFGRSAKSYILQHHSREYETNKLLSIYKEVIQTKKSSEIKTTRSE
ncbi:glycosyltransferase [Bacillus sp. SG-1]|uniref:glycosyltransferase n=1 Tax=Bacillus sp. SG-1 TaxID=161544 RepID=UPI0001543795|nr:glycosyltransferase [Bacillus sp. SG-1]EDL66346.1 Glycosyl transferase, group 1 [Bacillus sp. SG-1]